MLLLDSHVIKEIIKEGELGMRKVTPQYPKSKERSAELRCKHTNYKQNCQYSSPTCCDQPSWASSSRAWACPW